MVKFYFAVIIAFLAYAHSYAQQDTSKINQLEEVVVTGQYQPQSAKNSVYQVRVITRERIRMQGATRLQDVLNNELNIRFSQDLATGGSNIELMGLPGQNVKILLDGIPVTGRQGTSNEININQIDINAIERIEIVEGPMSVMFGADALAGVINIITRKPSKEKISINTRLHEETVGQEYGIQQGIHNQSADAGWQNKRWRVSGGFGRNYFGGWKGNATGRELEWHKKDQLLGNVLVGYKGDKWNLYYRLDGLDETITNPGDFVNGQALDQDYLSNRLMHQLQGAVHVNNRLSFQGMASLTDYSREIYSTTVKTNGDRRLAIGEGLQDVTNFTGITLRGTALYALSSKLSLQPGYDINLENGDGERIKTGKQEINDYAFFISSEYMPVRQLKIRPGVRFIKNSVYDAPPVIPSLNTKLAITPGVDFRLAYARGFRSPSIRELYFYFFDSNHQIIGNTNLKAETSNSFTGSIEWRAIKEKSVSLTATLSGFYNDVDNLISIGQSAGNATVFTYINVAKYKTRGGGINNQINIKNFRVSLGASYTGRYNEYSEADPALPVFKWSPELNSNLSYSSGKAGFSASISYKYTGRLPSYQLATVNNQQEVQLTETSGYHWADLSINKKIFRLFNINAGIRNLFNIKNISNTASSGSAHSESGPRPVGYGRSFFAGLAFSWTKY